MQTPARLIESDVKNVHDEDMDALVNLPVESLIDPAVLVPAAVASAALISGVAARVIDVFDRRR